MPRRLQLLTAILLGIAAGLGLAWLLKRAETRIAPAPRLNVADNSPVQPAPANEPVAPAPAAPSPPARPTPAAPGPVGTGIVRGVVNWNDGAPCVGLPVVAERTFTGLPSVRGNAEATHSERLAYYENLVAWNAAYTLRATTGDDGRFEITGLHEGGYRLSSGDVARAFTKPWVICKAGDDLWTFTGPRPRSAPARAKFG